MNYLLFIILLLMLTIGNLKSQTPPTPPIPLNNSLSNTNISTSQSNGNERFDFSCTFDKEQYTAIAQLIQQEFPAFSPKLEGSEEGGYWSIALKKKKLKMMYEVQMDKRNEIDVIHKIKRLVEKIQISL